MANDKQIGARIRRLRGDLSQKSLAEQMKDRGWKWSQPTVVSIEGGDRALKFAEAKDLADVLGVQIGDLLEDAPGAPQVQMVMAWADVRRGIEGTSASLRGLAEHLNSLADAVEANPEIARELWGDDDAAGADWEQWVAHELRSSSALPGQGGVVSSPARRDAVLRSIAAIAEVAVSPPKPDHG